MKKKIFICSLACLIAISSCGFKPINQLNQKKHSINEVEIEGEKRIGYLIKNEILLNSSSDAKDKFNIKLNINKKKEIKDKNIAGKISSYRIILNITLSLEDMRSSKKTSNNFSKSTIYDVAKNHSDTLSNEKNATKNLTEIISEDINNFLRIYFNKN